MSEPFSSHDSPNISVHVTLNMMPVRHLLGPRVTYEGYKGDMLLELSGFLSKVAGSFELLRMISEIVPSVIRGYHNHCVWPEGSKEIKIQKMFLL